MNFSIDEVDISWRSTIEPHTPLLNQILIELSDNHTPARHLIFRAFTLPLDQVKVVIVGQDPYPGQGVADGLAFSSLDQKIPASLRNIFKEYSQDLEIAPPSSADLSRWHENGVLLLNRTLTTTTGERNAHYGRAWNSFTSAIAREIGKRDVVAILWGANARELAPFFNYRIESAHPSPLSARHGFFGSKPFSNANRILSELGREEVDWTL
jgi:uracil-DNA glycosylase